MLPPPSRLIKLRFRGLTLIEILVSVVLLSLGVLAAIALQVVSKRNNLDSSQQTSAAQIAYELIERMRANSSPDALNLYLNNSPHLQGFPATAPSPACNAVAECTPVERARFDLWEIGRQVQGNMELVTVAGVTTAVGGLVSPTTCITGPAAGASGFYEVVMAWRSTTSLPSDTTIACGLGATGGGAALYGNSDEFRRTARVRAYIAN